MPKIHDTGENSNEEDKKLEDIDAQNDEKADKEKKPEEKQEDEKNESVIKDEDNKSVSNDGDELNKQDDSMLMPEKDIEPAKDNKKDQINILDDDEAPKGNKKAAKKRFNPAKITNNKSVHRHMYLYEAYVKGHIAAKGTIKQHKRPKEKGFDKLVTNVRKATKNAGTVGDVADASKYVVSIPSKWVYNKFSGVPKDSASNKLWDKVNGDGVSYLKESMNPVKGIDHLASLYQNQKKARINKNKHKRKMAKWSTFRDVLSLHNDASALTSSYMKHWGDQTKINKNGKDVLKSQDKLDLMSNIRTEVGAVNSIIGFAQGVSERNHRKRVAKRIGKSRFNDNKALAMAKSMNEKRSKSDSSDWMGHIKFGISMLKAGGTILDHIGITKGLTDKLPFKLLNYANTALGIGKFINNTGRKIFDISDRKRRNKRKYMQEYLEMRGRKIKEKTPDKVDGVDSEDEELLPQLKPTQKEAEKIALLRLGVEKVNIVDDENIDRYLDDGFNLLAVKRAQSILNADEGEKHEMLSILGLDDDASEDDIREAIIGE